jgi:Ca2+-binding EF-hand superfamily protein
LLPTKAWKERNGDGVITEPHHTHPSFTRADQYKNGSLSRDENQSIHRRHFNDFDKNGDGQLTADEMKSPAKRQ